MSAPLPVRDVVVVHSSDLHVDHDYTARLHGGDGTAGLACVLNAARGMGADVVILAGDTFDSHRVPHDLIERAAAVIAGAAFGAGESPRDALDQRGVVDFQLDHRVEPHFLARQQLVERLGLRDGARKAVEDEAAGAIRLLDAWARFCRELVLISASEQPLTLAGTRLPLAPGITGRKDALKVLRTIYKRFPWEPQAIPRLA